MKIPKGYGRFNEEEIEDIEQSDEEYYNSQNASFGNFLKIIFSKIATLCSKVGNALKYRLNKTANYIRAHLIPVVAVVVIIGVILPIVVFTVKWDKTIDGVTYSYNRSLKGYEAISYDNSISTSLEIPSEIEGTKVVSIASGTFSGCDLLEIYIPTSVRVINEHAFQECESLTKITIPFVGKQRSEDYDVNYDDLFYNWNDTQIRIKEQSFNYIFGGEGNIPASLREIDILDGAEISIEAFSGCENVNFIKLPNSVLKIRYFAFRGCTSLNEIIIPNSVTEIQSGVFEECTSLCEITLPFVGTKQEIADGEDGSSRFNSIFGYGVPYSLKDVVVTNETRLEEDSFYGCESIQNVTFLDGLLEVESYAFYDCPSLKSVVIPKSVQKIGDSFIYNCPLLENLEIPFIGFNRQENLKLMTLIDDYENLKTLTITDAIEIADEALSFYGNNKLAKLSLNEGIIKIGASAFVNCSHLSEINIPDSLEEVGYGIFENCERLITEYNGAYYVNNWLYKVNSNLNYIDLRYDTVGILSLAFIDYYGEIFIPANVNKILSGAFYSCSIPEIRVDSNNQNYKSVNGDLYSKDGKTLLAISQDEWAEYNEFTVPEGVETLCDYLFTSERRIEVVNLSSTVKDVSAEVFFDSCVSNIFVSPYNENYKAVDGVLYSKDGKDLICFPPFKFLDYYEILEGTENIKEYAFTTNSYNVQLQLQFPNTIKQIESYAFAYRSNIVELDLPEGLQTICDYAFVGSGIKGISIPSSVESIGRGIFADCWNLYSLVTPFIGKTVDDDETCDFRYLFSFVDGDWYDCNIIYLELTKAKRIPDLYMAEDLEWLVIPSTVEVIDSVGSWDDLYYIEVAENNPNYKSIDGNLYSKDGKTLVRYAGGKTDSDFIIPEGVTIIGSDAFNNSNNLASVSIPEGVTAIGNSAFEGCNNLKTVIIPEGVTIIGDYAFYCCNNLVSVSIPESIMFISSGAFEYCNNLVYNEWDGLKYLGNESNPHLYLASVDKDLFTAVVYENCKVIGTGAFEDCNNLISVTLPNSITYIGSSNFEYIENVSSIIYLGTMEQWDLINNFSITIDLGSMGEYVVTIDNIYLWGIEEIICSDGIIELE